MGLDIRGPGLGVELEGAAVDRVGAKCPARDIFSNHLETLPLALGPRQESLKAAFWVGGALEPQKRRETPLIDLKRIHYEAV